jgi:RNA polymerase sigma-70 factor, ECF subfamily
MMALRVVRPNQGPGERSGARNPRRVPPGSWSGMSLESGSVTEQEPKPKPSLDPAELERFERTFLPHMRAAYNLARWLTRNDQDAEDVVQEACLRAVRFFGGFRGGDSRAWLLTIVRNACYSRGRMQEATIPFDEQIHDVEDEALGPEDLLLQKASRRVLVDALEELPVEFREALVLRELEGLSYKEMAEVTQLPIGTVMSRLARARKRLRRCLQEQMEGGPA